MLAIARPVVECNRAHVDNGRTYLREMVFGDSAEPRHREALEITARTEAAIRGRPGLLRQDHDLRGVARHGLRTEGQGHPVRNRGAFRPGREWELYFDTLPLVADRAEIGALFQKLAQP
ncbi:hypothetical protein [Streptomyces sp. NPDC012508]|uniref:hypothetical protein n=1 Tax=Streptomyces sp. NPDC012508 TaxID=3364837 RepID=UPI003681EA3A